VEQPPCGNHTITSNRLMRMATGDIICFLHQDDYWLPQRLLRIQQVMLDRPELVMLVHPTRFINAAQHVIGHITCPLPAGRPLAPEEVLPHLLVQNFFTIVSSAIRRDALLAVGGFDESLWYTGDWDLWLKLCQRGPCLYLDETLSVYRVHRHSQTITHSNIPNFRRQFETVLERHLSRLPPSLPHLRAVAAAAQASVELNILFFTLLHCTRIEWGRLLGAFLRLTPRAWAILWRDGRLLERIPSRLRAQLTR
jgi:GT2 family glycosyltransferase